MTDVEQADDGGDRALLAQATALQIGLHLLAQAGQGGAELAAPVIFGGLLRGAEVDMIAILLAALLVPADRLDMAIGLGAEPGALIGGGQARSRSAGRSRPHR